jgi:DNA-binding response OmpR family regulator
MARILLLEPDKMLAKTYLSALNVAGHSVDVAATAQSAIGAADGTKPDIVVMELQLVSHSGVEFLYEFRSYTDWQDVPVIVLSHVPAAEFAASHDLLKRLGVKLYLYKPQTSLKKLVRAVAGLVPIAAT